MKEFTVSKNEQHQRFSKYLDRLLKEAGSGFIYKMLRKKNITLNDLRADGTELLVAGDVVKLYLSDETFDKFSGNAAKISEVPLRFSEHPSEKRSIIFENPELLLIYKPAGVLSQKDRPESDSLNEQVLQYLADKGEVTRESLLSFKPGICNRLDRNTSGLVCFAKTLPAMQLISEALKERTLKKYYLAVVAGKTGERFSHSGWLIKDEATNTVRVLSGEIPGAAPIETRFRTLVSNSRLSVLRIELVTGKSHQIRSVLSHLGHPVLGDPKYSGDNAELLRELKLQYGLRFQLLLCYQYHFPMLPEPLLGLSDRDFYSPVPKSFLTVLKEEFPDFRIPRGL